MLFWGILFNAKSIACVYVQHYTILVHQNVVVLGDGGLKYFFGTYDPRIEDSYRTEIQDTGEEEYIRDGSDSVPIMLVGNKCEKITEREVSREEGLKLARELGCV
ncbi:8380_t:CDS:2 [Ambispora leptoticha]|uniref:8380_t:CDS:1 n=1 Tax=Ambispora leptoticha TaxID=144679 RepID=A0A9N9BR37_9GLOM|nr:8380_t:CDS:2 [Ambispora leptoticha]